MSTSFTFSLLVLAVSAASCRPEKPAPVTELAPNVVAMVAGRAVTRPALEAELVRRGPGVTKEAALGGLVRQEAMLAQIRATGFDREPAIVAAIERLLVARLEERELAASEAPVVSEDEVRAAYADDAARFAVPAAVRGGVLSLRSSPRSASEKRAAVAERAERLRLEAQAADGATFERLVREHSEDQATRYQAGDTGWLVDGAGNGGRDPALVEALRALQRPGDCAPVVATASGFHIVRLTGRRPATTRPLTEVGPAIRHQLQQAKREQATAAFHARMRAGLDIRTNAAVLAGIVAPDPSALRPPALP